MGKNRKERFIFTLLMCALMVLGMSIYNVLLVEGASVTFFKALAVGYVPAFAVALILDICIAGKLAKGIAGSLLNAQTPMIKRMLVISVLMVSTMVLLMSFYGAVIHEGFSAALPKAYLTGVLLNFICALPLQLLLVGPLVRSLFVRLYPLERTAVL